MLLLYLSLTMLCCQDLRLLSVLWYCWLGLLTCKNRLPYNLYCVGGDVKHCSINQSINLLSWSQNVLFVLVSILTFTACRQFSDALHLLSQFGNRHNVMYHICYIFKNSLLHWQSKCMHYRALSGSQSDWSMSDVSLGKPNLLNYDDWGDFEQLLQYRVVLWWNITTVLCCLHKTLYTCFDVFWSVAAYTTESLVELNVQTPHAVICSPLVTP